MPMSTRLLKGLLLFCSMVAGSSVGAAPIAVNCTRFADGFETGRLDRSTWHVIQLYNDQLEIAERGDEPGNSSARLFLTQGDIACGGSCQRNEIRVVNDQRCRFGEEVWYRFRFRIDGTIPEDGSIRWVIGQWKQESGGSPFLAQRFDNGVFHITVQRNRDRILVTRSNGNPNARSGRPDQVGFLGHTSKVRRAARGGAATDPIDPTIDRDPFEVFRFQNEQRDGSLTDVTVELGADPLLPDPREDWVEMLYRVRGGVDGTGFIEIWANGIFKARVTGTIGNDNSAGPTQYFKFGLYRDIHESFGPAHFYLDDFRRAPTREGVEN